MRTNFKNAFKGSLVAGVFFLPLGTAFAIDTPEDDAQPPAALQEKFSKRAANGASQKSTPFIGVATASLPEMVADHLGFEAGSGVIIRTIQPDSPASRAGLAVHDIILKIGDSAVKSPEELSSLIRSQKVGDQIQMQIIHQGKPGEVEVTLGARPQERVANLDQGLMLEGLPEADAGRLRDLIERNLQAFGSDGPGFGSRLMPNKNFEQTFRKMRERMNQRSGEMRQLRGPAEGDLNFESSSTIRMMDSEGSVEIKSSGDDTEVFVRDRSNEIEWSGPWNTPEQKAAAPEELRKRIQAADSAANGGIALRFLSPKSSPDSIGH